MKPYSEHYRTLLRVGLPIVIGQLGIIILGFADTIMVGRHSTDELGAAGFVNNMFNLAIIFSTGFSYGLTPVVGSNYGKQDFAAVSRALKNSLPANTLIALFVCLCMGILYLNLENLGQPEELLPLMRPYFLTLLASLPFMLWFNAFKQFADGITDTRTSMWILLGGNVLNIVGNLLLIFGLCGFPELGLFGAGLSTLISRIVMCVVFALLFFCTPYYNRYRQHFFRQSVNRSDFRQLNRLGWPIALQMGMETASFSLSAIMMGWLGVAALAAHQIMCTVGTLCFMVYYGIGAAITIRVSYFHGQKDSDNVHRSAYAGFHLILLSGIVACTAIVMLRHQLSGWFTESSAVDAIVLSLILPMMLYQFGDGMQVAFANALRGIADVKPMMLYAFIAYFLISLPAGYLFGFLLDMGSVGVWLGFPFGLTSAGLMFYMRFKKYDCK